MIHKNPHPLAGKTVNIVAGYLKGEKAVVEDYWDRVYGSTWIDALIDRNPAAINYAVQSKDSIPTDEEILYGKIGGFGYLFHCTEVGEVVA